VNVPQLNVYDVMAEPPFDAGGANPTVARPLPVTAEVIAGAPGTVAGVTLFEGADASPGPCALVAVTVKV
jgi:hypothetical protein